MRPHRFLLVVALSLALGWDPVAAQVASSDTVFVGSHHSPVVSGIVEWLLPTAGFAYAGDWSRGFLPSALRTISYVGWMKTGGTSRCDGACPVWGGALLATTTWAIVGAVDAARDHNARVRETLSALSVAPSSAGGVALGARLVF